MTLIPCVALGLHSRVYSTYVADTGNYAVSLATGDSGSQTSGKDIVDGQCEHNVCVLCLSVIDQSHNHTQAQRKKQ